MGFWRWKLPRHVSKGTKPPSFVLSFLRGERRKESGIPADQSEDPSQGIISLPGATVATLLMLGALHAKRLYEEKKIDEGRQKGIEPEFTPDVKAAFLQFLPLRFISRAFGLMTSLEIPVWARPHVYRGYCRAFHANLDEVAEDLKNYTCLRDFFTRTLKEGSRPLDVAPTCLLSPVDGIVLRCGQVRGPGAVVEQVKGFSYSLRSLLGADPPYLCLPHSKLLQEQETEENNCHLHQGSFRMEAEINVRNPVDIAPSSKRPVSSLFYCVLYLGPGDYHRVHSPTDWHVLYRRYFSGHLFPVNERAARTIKNLYVTNERVVLEGRWSQGYMALVAVGATNVGSIELKVEPGLKTNYPTWNVFSSEPLNVLMYGDRDSGLFVKKGQEMAVFNLGSTVILVFQAPFSFTDLVDHVNEAKIQFQVTPGFSFRVKSGDRVKMGQALGHW